MSQRELDTVFFTNTYTTKDDNDEDLTVEVTINGYGPPGVKVDFNVVADAAERAADYIFDDGFHYE